MRVTLNTDAAIRGVHVSTETPKRGRAAIGFIIKDAGGKLVKRGGLALADTATVTEAEYSGLIAGLHNCYLAGATEVDVVMDSQLVIKQMTREWAIHEPRVREYADEARHEAARFANVTFTWKRRAHNTEADGLANKYLDAA